MKKFTTLLILLLSLSFIAAAQTDLPSIALLPFENMSNEPDQNYLQGIIRSLLEEDLSGSGTVQIVDRDNLEDVLEEQKLQYTGLMDEENALEAGRLLGASFILGGSYVFLGQDIFININLIEVETGKTRTFSQRGYRENTVHALAEKLVVYMTGQEPTFQNPRGDRSILAMKQQEPGQVSLYSYIIDARVYIDEEFVGYTTGDRTVPLSLEVQPGKHTIRLHLTQNFGVIELPEVTFSDWQEDFELLPGEKLILQDKTRHFNETLYELQQQIRDDLELKIQEGETLKEVSESAAFQDRQGKRVDMELSVRWEKISQDQARATAFFTYNGEEHSFEYTCVRGKDEDYEESVGKVRLEMDLDCRSDWNWELDYSVWRTDIYQGLHREED